MSESFQLGGDPAEIRGSARLWSTFSQAASSAATGIRSLDTADFVGDEAETYKQQITADLPKHLDIASKSWGVVAAALETYATALERHQRDMNALAVKAGNQQSTVNSCQTAVQSAKTSDRSHALSVLQAKQALKPGQQLPPDSYVSTAATDQRSLNNANSALQATYDAASTVRSENAASVRQCRSEIDRAKGMRFAKPPGFWGRLKNSVCGWIADHAGVLMQISSVLKTISGIAGVLALVPGLGEIMGPIALVTGGAALAIDVGVKLATGKGSWTQIGLDALSMVPGARAARLAFAANTAYGGYQVATGKESLADFALNTGMGALAFKGGGGKFGNERVGGEPPRGVVESPAGGQRPDIIEQKLNSVKNQALSKWQDGTPTAIDYTSRQKTRIAINRRLGRTNDMSNTFKGDRLDKWMKEQVQNSADPDLKRLTTTGRGKLGPDWRNPNKRPNEADWYDLTTRKSWQSHVEKYTGKVPIGKAKVTINFGSGTGIFWS